MFFFFLAGMTGSAIVISIGNLSVTSDVPSGGDLPISSIRLKTDGQLQTAEGDSGSPLSYSNVSGSFLSKILTGAASEYEAKLTETSTSGAAGTITGTLASFQDLASQTTWSWQKDTNSLGTATWNGTLEIRHKTVTSYTETVTVTLVSSCSA